VASYTSNNGLFAVSTSGSSTYLTITVRSYGIEGTVFLYRDGSLIDYSKSVVANGSAMIGITGLSSNTTYTWKIIIPDTTTDEITFTTIGGNDSGGGSGGDTSGCVLFDGATVRSSSYDSSTGNITVQLRLYYWNSSSSSKSATIYYSIDDADYFSQSVNVSGDGSGYITCNMTIYVGKNYSGTSYDFSFNGYIKTSGCNNDYFDESLTATWTGTITPTRPAKFYWISSSSNLTKGSAVSTYITATKWKQLQTNINEVRAYKGLGNYTFTTVSSGSTSKASYYNEMANAINAMLASSSSYRVATVSTGDPITATVMNKL
jgi:hypothetical protein